MATETHIAGMDIEVDGRYLIQRCAWCGTVLLSYDYANVAVAGDTWEKPGVFQAGTLVRYSYDGPVARWGEVSLSRTSMEVLEDSDRLPCDACARAIPIE